MFLAFDGKYTLELVKIIRMYTLYILDERVDGSEPSVTGLKHYNDVQSLSNPGKRPRFPLLCQPK